MTFRRITGVLIFFTIVFSSGGTGGFLQAAVSAMGWGGSASQLGTGGSGVVISPAQVVGMSYGVNAVAAGGSNCLFVQNGALFASGSNSEGELGNGGTISSNTPIAVRLMSSGITSIAAEYVGCVAVQNGCAYSWGQNYDGGLGNGTASNAVSTPTPVINMTSGVTAISAAFDLCLAIKNGALYGWGSDASGQIGNGTTGVDYNSAVPASVLTSGVTAIAAGDYVCAAVQNGAVYTWGSGTLGNGTSTSSSIPVLVNSLASGATAIACGEKHTMALVNGSVYVWGTNTYGQLGNGSTASASTPTLVNGISSTITAIAAGNYSSYALASDGSLWDWGYNSYGQLGLGTTTATYNTPQHIFPPAGRVFISIAAGDGNNNVVARLAAPDSSASSTASYMNLGSVTPVASGIAYDDMYLGAGAISGSIGIGLNFTSQSSYDAVYLGLADPTQANALVADLDIIYGSKFATLVTSDPYDTAYQVVLNIPVVLFSTGYFNFDFTTVVNAGPGGNTAGSVAIVNVGVVPEPSMLGLVGMGVAGLCWRKKR